MCAQDAVWCPLSILHARTAERVAERKCSMMRCVRSCSVRSQAGRKETPLPTTLIASEASSLLLGMVSWVQYYGMFPVQLSYAFPRVRCGLERGYAAGGIAQARPAHAPCLIYHSALPANLQLHSGAVGGTIEIAHTPVPIHGPHAWFQECSRRRQSQVHAYMRPCHLEVAALGGLPVFCIALQHRTDAFEMHTLSAHVF